MGRYSPAASLSLQGSSSGLHGAQAEELPRPPTQQPSRTAPTPHPDHHSRPSMGLPYGLSVAVL